MYTFKQKLINKINENNKKKEAKNNNKDDQKFNISKKWEDIDFEKKFEEKKQKQDLSNFKKKLIEKKRVKDLKTFDPILNNNHNNNQSYYYPQNYNTINSNYLKSNNNYNTYNNYSKNNDLRKKFYYNSKFDLKKNNYIKKEKDIDSNNKKNEITIIEEEKIKFIKEKKIKKNEPVELLFSFKDYENIIKEYKDIKTISNDLKYINFEIKYQTKKKYEKYDKNEDMKSKKFENNNNITNGNIKLNKSIKINNNENKDLFISRNIDKEKLKKINTIKENANSYIFTIKEVSDHDKILLDIRSQLNKITPENYNSVLKNLKLYINKNEYTEKLIKNLVEKAWNEHVYASSYANLLLDILKNENNELLKKVKIYIIDLTNEKFSKGFKNFKSELNEKIKNNINNIEKIEFITNYKNRLFGNINFILELFILNFYKNKIIKCMISELIDNIIVEFNIFLKDKNNLISFELYFQGLIRIFEYCGKEISIKLNKKRLNEKNIKETRNYFETLKLRIKNKDTKNYEDKYIKDKNFEIDYENLTFEFFNFMKNLNDFPIKIQLLIENIIQFKKSNYLEDIIKFKKPKKLNEIDYDNTNNNNNNDLNIFNEYVKVDKISNEEDIEERLLDEYNNKINFIFKNEDLNSKNWIIEFKKIYDEKIYKNLNYVDKILEFFYLNSTPRKQIFYDLTKDFIIDLFKNNNLIDKEFFFVINLFYVKYYDCMSELNLFQKFLIELIYNLYEKKFLIDENFEIDFLKFYKENINEEDGDLDEDKEDDLIYLKKDFIKKFKKYLSDNEINNSILKLLY